MSYFEEVVKEVEEQTSCNYHNEARLTIARKLLFDPQVEQALFDIELNCEHNSYLSDADNATRMEITINMLSVMKTRLTPEQFTKLKGAL